MKFCVIYRFKLRPGSEASFKEGWRRLTEEIRDQRGGLGSRLHHGEDGWWYAYAQWLDRAGWERSQDMQAQDTEAVQLMADAIEKRKPPILLEPEIDLLVKS